MDARIDISKIRQQGRAEVAASLSAERYLLMESPVEAAAAMSEPRGPDTSPYRIVGRTAVIDVIGGIMSEPIVFFGWRFGTNFPDLTASLKAADADPDVDDILWVMRSPGGAVRGIAGLRSAIAGAEKPQRVHAKLMASAALWGWAGLPITVDEDGLVGSKGVYMVRPDFSHANESGNQVHVLSVGEGKVDAHPYAPLTDAARARIMEDLEELGREFDEAVAEGCDLSAEQVESLGARVFRGRRAVEAGLADSVETLDHILEEATMADKTMTGTLAALGLNDTATDAEAVTAVNAMRTKVDQAESDLVMAKEALAETQKAAADVDTLKARVTELEGELQNERASAEAADYDREIRGRMKSAKDDATIGRLVAMARNCAGDTISAKVEALAGDPIGAAFLNAKPNAEMDADRSAAAGAAGGHNVDGTGADEQSTQNHRFKGRGKGNYRTV